MHPFSVGARMRGQFRDVPPVKPSASLLFSPIELNASAPLREQVSHNFPPHDCSLFNGGFIFTAVALQPEADGDRFDVGPPVAQGQKLAVETPSANDLCIDGLILQPLSLRAIKKGVGKRAVSALYFCLILRLNRAK